MNNTTTNKPLTQEQSDFASKHYYLIENFLRIKGYPSDDFFDVVVFGFLRAVRRYTEREALQQNYKFKTIAFRCMRDDIYKHFQYQNRSMRKAEMCTYNEDSDVPYYADSVWEDFSQKHDADIAADTLSEILTPQQRQIAYLKGDGYCHRDIAAQTGLSFNCVKREVKAVRETIQNQAVELFELIAA